MADVFVYGKNSVGGRNVGVELDGLRILVESKSEDSDEHALRVARSIAERHEANVVADGEREQHRRKVLELCSMIDRANERAALARSALVSAIEGRRRFFGPVLCVPGRDGWAGEVWLLDPEKRDRGYGLRFHSLRILREEHPELWVVRPDGDGILLDAYPMPEVR